MGMEGFDRDQPALPAAVNRLIEAVQFSPIPVYLANGSVTMPWLIRRKRSSRAGLAAGRRGAAADLLFAGQPSGKLAETLPRRWKIPRLI